MQDIWFGELRDRVKWGGVVYLAKRYHIKHLIQVLYQRAIARELKVSDGKSDNRPEPVPTAVWKFFSDLTRIRELERAVGVRITVVDSDFSHCKRHSYIDKVVAKELNRIKGRKLVLLDPDTGLAPPKSACKREHAALYDVEQVWQALNPSDWLAVYQHGSHDANWLRNKRCQFAEWCRCTSVVAITGENFARDMVILAAQNLGGHPNPAIEGQFKTGQR